MLWDILHYAFIKNIQIINYNNLNIDEWKELFHELCEWSIKIDQINNIDFKKILDDEKEIINNYFSKYIEKTYKYWIDNPLDRPMLSSDIFEKCLPVQSS